jgi:hypothetical protein
LNRGAPHNRLAPRFRCWSIHPLGLGLAHPFLVWPARFARAHLLCQLASLAFQPFSGIVPAGLAQLFNLAFHVLEPFFGLGYFAGWRIWAHFFLQLLFYFANMPLDFLGLVHSSSAGHLAECGAQMFEFSFQVLALNPLGIGFGAFLLRLG